LRNFAWLHVEPRPVPELAWFGKFITRAVPLRGFRSEDLELCKERLPVFWLARCSALLMLNLDTSTAYVK
jgi:hypothetical protein